KRRDGSLRLLRLRQRVHVLAIDPRHHPEELIRGSIARLRLDVAAKHAARLAARGCVAHQLDQEAFVEGFLELAEPPDLTGADPDAVVLSAIWHGDDVGLLLAILEASTRIAEGGDG